MALLTSKRFKLVIVVLFHTCLTFISSAFLAISAFILIGAVAGTLEKTILGVLQRFITVFLFLLPLPLPVLLTLYLQYVKLPPPGGVTLLSQEYREQYEKINRICHELECPEIKNIYFDSSMDVKVYEYTRFGHLIGRKLHLTIGIPLVLALSDSEFLALVAQRCACYSKKHDKDTRYAYRSMSAMRAVFDCMDDRFQNLPYDSSILLNLFPLLRQYLPAVEKLYYETKESHILYSDQLAVEAFGRDALISALLRQYAHVQAGTADQFWQDISNKNDSSPIPPVHIYRSMELWMLKQLPDEHLFHFTQESSQDLPLSQRPSLRKRLMSLGYDNTPIYPVKLNALSQFMQGESYALLDYLGRLWIDSSKQRWQKQYDIIAQSRQNLEDLKQKCLRGPLDKQDYIELAKLALQTKFIDDTIELLQPGLESDPDNEHLACAIGQLMLAKGDSSGASLLERIAFNKDLMLIRYRLLLDYFIGTRQFEKAIVCYRNGVSLVSKDEDCYSERQNVRPDEKPAHPVFVLNEASLIMESLKSISQIEKIYVAGKHLAECPYFPVFIIGLQFTKLTSPESIKAILDQLPAKGMIPWDYHFVVLNRKKCRKIACKLALMDSVRLK